MSEGLYLYYWCQTKTVYLHSFPFIYFIMYIFLFVYCVLSSMAQIASNIQKNMASFILTTMSRFLFRFWSLLEPCLYIVLKDVRLHESKLCQGACQKLNSACHRQLWHFESKFLHNTGLMMKATDQFKTKTI